MEDAHSVAAAGGDTEVSMLRVSLVMPTILIFALDDQIVLIQ
jgi:hypothetical protein